MAHKDNNGDESNGANLGLEGTLWRAADKLRNNGDAVEYKHVVLGPLFLKHISDAFNEAYDKLRKDPTSDQESEEAGNWSVKR
jgi:type I restriction enzyme M protein